MVGLKVPVLKADVFDVKSESKSSILIVQEISISERIDLDFPRQLFKGVVHPVVVVFENPFNHEIVVQHEGI